MCVLVILQDGERVQDGKKTDDGQQKDENKKEKSPEPPAKKVKLAKDSTMAATAKVCPHT